MTKKPRENRVPIMMSEDELAAIDDWRFDNRVATRSDAVRRLCQIGLEADANWDRVFKLVDEQVPDEMTRVIEIAKAMKDAETADEQVGAIRDFMQVLVESSRRNMIVRNALEEMTERASAYRDDGTLDELKAKVEEIENEFGRVRRILKVGKTLKGAKE